MTAQEAAGALEAAAHELAPGDIVLAAAIVGD
jgi:hypothetical protein